MKKVILEEGSTISESMVDESTPIFAKLNGILNGMIVKEEKGWILRLGGRLGSSGFHTTREKLMRAEFEYGKTFYIEED